MFNSMKKLIEKKFYKTASEAQGKLDVFFAVSRLNMEEYTTLTLLVEEKYADDDKAVSGLLEED